MGQHSPDIESNDFSSEFPQDESICYLNHAAVSPWPIRTQLAVSKFAEENVLFGATHYLEWLKVDKALREKLARLINAKSYQDIALSKSTSEALSIIAYGLSWEKGDEIIITNQEFPSNRIVWESLANKGVSVNVANIDTIDSITTDPIDAIAEKISENTKLISVSSVQYASGLTLDLKRLGALCTENNILFCVDAIQSLGAIPFDLTDNYADFVVADGHKWMMGPEGLALFYVNPEIRDSLTLNQYGWHMVANRGDYTRQEWEAASDATRFECGSPNTLGIHALNASLSLLEELGITNIHARLKRVTKYLTEQLVSISDIEILSPSIESNQSGIVTFRIRNINSENLYSTLMKQGVICACRGGGVRFSPHFYTSQVIIDNAITKIKTIISTL
jgi:selenocysteine lyase/cysteine desulfurase